MATSFDPTAVLGQLIASYARLPLSQKVAFPVLIMASVAGIVFVSNWATAPDYTVLYSDLEPGDSAAVVERLKTQKVKYQVRADGGTIAISPPELVHELRISLAAEGIPKGGVVGFEIFDTTNLGTTSFVEKLKFVRALQGELERTITSLESISSARVHITKPEKTVFATKGAVPTASVMLRLRSMDDMDPGQVKGIANLVAASVEGLTPENVTIIDVHGNLLTDHDQNEDGLGIETTRLQYQRELERGFVREIEEMLRKVVGPGKVIARVNAVLDFSSTEREEESYDPGGQVARSERRVSEGQGGAERGGIPGVVSNLTNDPALLAPPQTGANSSRREDITNYEISRAVTRSTVPRGRMVRLSVAVLVDGTYAVPDGAAEDVPEQFQPLDPDMLRQIENLVKSAVGYDPARGDTVTVENVPFHAPDTSLLERLDQQAHQDMIFNVISKAVPVLFVLLFFFIVVRPLIRFIITPTEAELDLSRLLPTGIEELETELSQERTNAGIPEIEPAIDIEQLEDLLKENSTAVKQNPQQAALLIRYWLNDGRL